MRTNHFISEKYEGSVSEVQHIGMDGHTRMILSSQDLNEGYPVLRADPHPLHLPLRHQSTSAANDGVTKDTDRGVV